jgi:hypothetical protein
MKMRKEAKLRAIAREKKDAPVGNRGWRDFAQRLGLSVRRKQHDESFCQNKFRERAPRRHIKDMTNEAAFFCRKIEKL